MDNLKPKPSKHAIGKKQTSISFSPDLIEWLDTMTENTGINRSTLVTIMVRDFMEAGKTVNFYVNHPRVKPSPITEIIEKLPEMNVIEKRNNKILKLWEEGKTRRQIADQMKVSYQVVYSVTGPDPKVD